MRISQLFAIPSVLHAASPRGFQAATRGYLLKLAVSAWAKALFSGARPRAALVVVYVEVFVLIYTNGDSFGIAALLFLVTEELLLEAHEAQEHSAHEEHIWWVDMFFFLGFLLSFLMDKLLDTD